MMSHPTSLYDTTTGSPPWRLVKLNLNNATRPLFTTFHTYPTRASNSSFFLDSFPLSIYVESFMVKYTVKGTHLPCRGSVGRVNTSAITYEQAHLFLDLHLHLHPGMKSGLRPECRCRPKHNVPLILHRILH